MSKSLKLQNKRVAEVIMRESAHKSFGGYLLNFMTDLSLKRGEIVCNYKVPACLCNVGYDKSNTKRTYLPTSSILAVFDELSSNSLILSDETCRGGVSVHLTTTLLKPVYLNDSVKFVTKTDKIGKSIGFSTMELYSNSNNELVAKGKHIKFMPQGWWWEALMSPIVYPVISFAYNTFRLKTFKTCIDHLVIGTPASESIRNEHDHDEVGAMFKALSVQKVSNQEEFHHIPGHAENSAYYTVHIKTKMQNLLGMFHGGAFAATLEDACRSYKDEICQDMSINPIIQSFDIRYLSALQGSAIIQVHDDTTSAVIGTSADGKKVCYSKTFGSVINAKNKQVSAEFICLWKTYID